MVPKSGKKSELPLVQVIDQCLSDLFYPVNGGRNPKDKPRQAVVVAGSVGGQSRCQF
jgi:hypothetical protein